MPRFFIALFLLSSLSLFGQDKLIMSGSDNWYPIQVIDKESGRMSGIGYDIFTEICSRLNVTAEARGNIPWTRVLSQIEKGEIDIVSGIYYTEERAKKYLYTVPYMQNEIRIFVLKENIFHYEELNDLIGKSGVKPRGGKYGDEFETFCARNNLDLKEVSAKQSIYQMVLSGRVDYFISDYCDITYNLKKMGLDDTIVALPNPINMVDVYMVFSKKSPGSRFFLQYNRELIRMIQEGEVEQMLTKYK